MYNPLYDLDDYCKGYQTAHMEAESTGNSEGYLTAWVKER